MNDADSGPLTEAPMSVEATETLPIANAAENATEHVLADATEAPVLLEVTEDHLRLAEGLLFASTEPVPAPTLAQLLPEDADATRVLLALRDRYAGRGVELQEVAGGFQFRTAPDLAPRLKRVVQVPRRLPRAAMETLAIIAYHQPATRAEIEEIRGTTLSQSTLDALLEAGLVAPRGRKEVPGRPTLWGTTPTFLQQFGLKDLRDLPKREDLIVETASPFSQPKLETAEEGAAEEAKLEDGGAAMAEDTDQKIPAEQANSHVDQTHELAELDEPTENQADAEPDLEAADSAGQ